MPGINREAFLSKLKGPVVPPGDEIEVEGPPDEDAAMSGGEMLCKALGVMKKDVDYGAVEEAVRRIMEG